jgi:hypothetical protein
MLRACIRQSERGKERSTCKERIRKPVWIAKEKEDLVKMELESEEFQNDCHSILNFSEPAELHQPLSKDKKHPARKDEGFSMRNVGRKGKR